MTMQTMAKRETDPLTKLRNVLTSEVVQTDLRAVLPKHMSSDRMVKVLMSCVRRTPKLLECDFVSIAKCMVQSGELGLEIGGLLGEAYLVPFKGECTCIIGYQGLLKLARQSGEVRSVVARIVRRGERVAIDQAENTVSHPFDFESETSDAEMIGVYALATLTSGERVLEPMTRAQVDKVRARSKSGGSGPWVTDYEEMAKKTVLRRLCKMLPKSAERVAQLDSVERGDPDESPRLPAASPVNALTSGILARAAEIQTDDGELVPDLPQGRQPGED